MRSCLWLVACAVSCCVCFGQSFWVGGIGGGRVTGDVTGLGAVSVSNRYVLGPAVEVGLPLGLGFEADALYRRVGFSDRFYGGPTAQYGNSWEFPLLLKFRLPFPVVKPFVEAGYAPRVIGSANGTSHGLVIGGGVQFGIGRLRLSPAVRYTYWSTGVPLIVYADGPTLVTAQNQADILLGVAWRLR